MRPDVCPRRVVHHWRPRPPLLQEYWCFALTIVQRPSGPPVEFCSASASIGPDALRGETPQEGPLHGMGVPADRRRYFQHAPHRLRGECVVGEGVRAVVSLEFEDLCVSC